MIVERIILNDWEIVIRHLPKDLRAFINYYNKYSGYEIKSFSEIDKVNQELITVISDKYCELKGLIKCSY
jgi:hypothetical protein